MMTKLPDPVDWALHDYYSTAVEKAFVPIHSLTDVRKLQDPLPEPTTNLVYKKLQLPKQDFILVLSSNNPPAPLPVIELEQEDHDRQELRAALRSALELVEDDMQRNNHLTFPVAPVQSNDIKSSWSWKDDIIQDEIVSSSSSSSYYQESSTVLDNDSSSNDSNKWLALRNKMKLVADSVTKSFKSPSNKNDKRGVFRRFFSKRQGV